MIVESMNRAAKAAHDAYERTETLVEDHPLLSATIGIGVAIAAKIAFKGKLAILWPDAEAILKSVERETLGTEITGTPPAVSGMAAEMHRLKTITNAQGTAAESVGNVLTKKVELPTFVERIAPESGPLSDKNLIRVAMDARALFNDWWQACGEIKGLPVPSATSARDALRDLSDGTIDSRFIGHLEDGLTQLKTVSDLHPTAGQLAEAADKLRTSVSEIIDANGGESLDIGGKNWWWRPQPELVSTPLGALAPGGRFKLLSNSKHVYEVDALDEQVVYHHVDIPSLNQQRLDSNTSVFTVPNGADLLSGSEPVRGFHLGAKDPKFFEQASHPLTNMTRRGLTDYVEKLEIPPGELASSDHRILDIGAGAQQELARDAKAAGLRGQIISIDPGLALDEEKDLSRINYSMDKAYRIKGRDHAQPLTIAANGEALPFSDQSADAAYAMFSLPYWAKDATQVDTFLSEMGRVVKPGGYGRVYPVKEAQTSIVERWLAANGLNTKSELKFKPPNVGKGPVNRHAERDYYLLTMKY